MSSEEHQSPDSEIVRPSITVRKRHVDLLDELKAERYASRSEAVRAGIEQLAESVIDSGETNTEQLISRVEMLANQINDLAEQFDEIQDQPGENGGPRQSPKEEPVNNSKQITAAVGESGSPGNAKLENEVYSRLTERGPMAVPAISAHVSGSQLEVHDALKGLVEKGFVTKSEGEEPRRYRIDEFTN